MRAQKFPKLSTMITPQSLIAAAPEYSRNPYVEASKACSYSTLGTVENAESWVWDEKYKYTERY